MTSARRAAQRTPVLWAAALLLALTACTNDELPVAAPVDVDTCEELVDISVQLVEVWVEVLEELPLQELLSDEPPPEFRELAEIGNDLDQRASRLECDPEQMNADVRAELEESDVGDADGAVIELLLEIIQGGVVAELPPPAPTSTTGASS